MVKIQAVAVFGSPLEVFGEVPVAAQLGESPLHHPAPEQDDEALGLSQKCDAMYKDPFPGTLGHRASHRESFL